MSYAENHEQASRVRAGVGEVVRRCPFRWGARTRVRESGAHK